MKLSLSVRVAESPKRKDITDIPIEHLAPLAKAAGFQALSMRASVVSINSSPDRIMAVRQLLLPPCIRQRFLSLTAGFWQGVPLRVLARQR